MKNIYLVHGPNLNLLGVRNTRIYGSVSLEKINQAVREIVSMKNFSLEAYQSNSEGAILDFLHVKLNHHLAGVAKCQGLIINPAGLTHTSIALHDTLEVFQEYNIPVIEVHLSNVHSRKEDFRKFSFTSRVSNGVIAGLGAAGYEAAAHYLTKMA